MRKRVVCTLQGSTKHTLVYRQLDLYGPSRVRKSALPLPRRIVDGPEN
jgi:hypothetical protein